VTDEARDREISQLRNDLRDKVSRDVYDAHREALGHRITALEREMELAEESRTATRRWLVSAVVLPLVSMAVMIILALT
jgi:hypothetical protein